MNITDLIQGAVASRTTRFAFELLPPLKGDGTRSVFGAIDPLMDFNPAYINVTFHREALKEDIRPDGSREWHIMRRRPGTVGISAAIRRKYDVEVVPHLICGGWSKYDIEDSLIDMDFLGLHNVLALRGQAQGEARYDGYGSCPLTVERGKVVLAEFGYGGKLLPTFPLDPAVPRRLAWDLKVKMMPSIYFDMMLRGREWLAEPKRLPHEPLPVEAPAACDFGQDPRK